jgi:hypothetical protein
MTFPHAQFAARALVLLCAVSWASRAEAQIHQGALSAFGEGTSGWAIGPTCCAGCSYGIDVNCCCPKRLVVQPAQGGGSRGTPHPADLYPRGTQAAGDAGDGNRMARPTNNQNGYSDRCSGGLSKTPASKGGQQGL